MYTVIVLGDGFRPLRVVSRALVPGGGVVEDEIDRRINTRPNQVKLYTLKVQVDMELTVSKIGCQSKIIGPRPLLRILKLRGWDQKCCSNDQNF